MTLAASGTIMSSVINEFSRVAKTTPFCGTVGTCGRIGPLFMLRPSSSAGFSFEPGSAPMTLITASEGVVAFGGREVQEAQYRRGTCDRRGGRCQPDPHQVHIVERAARTRGPRFVRFGAHPADHAWLEPGPVVGRPRARRQPQRVPDRLNRAELARAGRTFTDVMFDCDRLGDRKLAIVKRLETTLDCGAGQKRHASLSSARSASRARASRDFTVPTATPSENPISS